MSGTLGAAAPGGWSSAWPNSPACNSVSGSIGVLARLDFSLHRMGSSGQRFHSPFGSLAGRAQKYKGRTLFRSMVIRGDKGSKRVELPGLLLNMKSDQTLVLQPKIRVCLGRRRIAR